MGQNPKINEIMESGAQTPFDIWFEWDKPKFDSEPVFEELLTYIKKNNTNI